LFLLSRVSFIALIGQLLFIAVLSTGCQQPPGPNPAPTPREGTPAPQVTPQQAKDTDKVDVVIVGAGLSGLTTAHELKKAGLSYRILEMEPRVGGRVRTGTYPDQSRAEVGLAEFWSGNPAIDLAKELNVELEKVEPGLSSFMVDGKLYPFTTYKTNQEFIQSVLKEDYAQYQAWDLTMADKIHQLESGPPSAELMKLKDISFADWLKDQPISPLARQMVKAVVDPEIGTSISKISALDGIAEWHIFNQVGATPFHCVGGNQKLTEAVADAVGRENISLNAQVTNVIDTAEGVEVRAVDTANFQNTTYRAEYVVLTVPLYRLFEIQFSPRLSDPIYKAVHTQTWGAYFTAHCLLDKEAAKFWTVDGINVLPVLSGGKLGVLYPGHAPEEGTVMINLLITGAPAEAFNSRMLSFDDVQKILERTMDETFPGSKDMIRRWTFYRYHPRAIASWPVKRSRFDELSEGLRKAHGRIYFAGDFTEGTHSDGAMKSAFRVSGQIKAALKK
jgi:monoamine oxidase